MVHHDRGVTVSKATAVVTVSDAVTPAVVLRMAIAQGADIDKIMSLMELQARFEFNAAMLAFKQNPPKISKNKQVEYETSGRKSKYSHATLDHACDQIIPALAAVGITHKWKPSQSEGQISITCILTHSAGHFEETTLTSGADESGEKNGVQAIASAANYLERYTLLAAVGLAAAGVDDDGRGVSSIPADAFESAIDSINAATSLKSVQAAFAVAYRLAEDAKDTHACTRFIEAKDAKKRTFAK